MLHLGTSLFGQRGWNRHPSDRCRARLAGVNGVAAAITVQQGEKFPLPFSLCNWSTMWTMDSVRSTASARPCMRGAPHQPAVATWPPHQCIYKNATNLVLSITFTF